MYKQIGHDLGQSMEDLAALWYQEFTHNYGKIYYMQNAFVRIT